MTITAPRILLAFASFLQLLGGVAHSLAFPKASAALATVHLPPFFINSFKALWLGDSTTMFALAAVLAAIAIRPSAATKPVVLLLGLIPLFVAALIYTFLGAFFAGHLLLATAVLIFAAGLQHPLS
jgi:hypothetical protein